MSSPPCRIREFSGGIIALPSGISPAPWNVGDNSSRELPDAVSPRTDLRDPSTLPHPGEAGGEASLRKTGVKCATNAQSSSIRHASCKKQRAAYGRPLFLELELIVMREYDSSFYIWPGL